MSYVSEEIQLKVLVPYANNSMEEFLTGFIFALKVSSNIFCTPLTCLRSTGSGLGRSTWEWRS